MLPRQDQNGDLPDIAFARLAINSDLIDKGTNLGYVFYGAAPDLGAFEYSPANATTKLDAKPSGAKLILTASGGWANATNYLLTSTNLALPVSQAEPHRHQHIRPERSKPHHQLRSRRLAAANSIASTRREAYLILNAIESYFSASST